MSENPATRIGPGGRMPRESIHSRTTIGPVYLVVNDLARELEFYERNIGLTSRRGSGAIAHLSAGGPDLLVLAESPKAPRVHRTTGLYHLALLVPSRRELRRMLAHLAATHTSLEGASDHGVSEALYLDDPEDNGI